MWYEFNKEETDVIIKHPRLIGSRWIRNEEVPAMLRCPDKNPDLVLTKIDKNGTKYYKTDICPACDGYGTVYLGESAEGYLCNKCSGSRRLEKPKIYKIHTHEYGLILEKKYIEKRNVKFLEKHGINEDYSTYVYIGETYSVKEDLKAKGAKFDSELSKWHSRELIDGYPYIKVFVPLRIYSDGLLGYDYGYAENESTFSSETRLN